MWLGSLRLFQHYAEFSDAMTFKVAEGNLSSTFTYFSIGLLLVISLTMPTVVNYDRVNVRKDK